MKKLFVIILIGLLMSSCQKEARTDYIIEGTAKDVYNGIRVYLNQLDQRGRPIPVDTAIVMNESFTFNGKVQYPTLYHLTMNSSNGRMPLMIENTEMKLTIDKKTINNSILSGSDSHDLLNEFDSEILHIRNDIKDISDLYRKSKSINDSALMKSHLSKLKSLRFRLKNYPIEYIKNNRGNYVALQIIESQLNYKNIDIDIANDLFNKINKTVQTSTVGVQLKGKIENIKKQQEILKARQEAKKLTEIGATAPQFSAPNPEGKELALSEVVNKGKITIIDFWAAWCGPCRRENPNLVKIYDQYHDKGLEIIGVSLDGRRGQQNPKGAWIKAIEDDKLTWNHVSNLTYFDVIAQSYNVNAIPAMFILDDKGSIIAKNLRGRALELKVAQLLN